MKKAPVISTYPAAGVMHTNPAIAPFIIPKEQEKEREKTKRESENKQIILLE
jgi:hypothetical protein